MPLNILKHKTWNIYNPEVIARIERDEREDAERRKKAQEKRERDEANNRYEQLTNRKIVKHINFFEDLEDQQETPQTQKPSGVALVQQRQDGMTSRFDVLVYGKKEKKREWLKKKDESPKQPEPEKVVDKKKKKKKKKKKTIEELRAERLEREQKERMRVKDLISKKRGKR